MRLWLLFCLFLSSFLFAENSALLGKIKKYNNPNYWQNTDVIPEFKKEDIINSIESIRAYYLNQQFAEGNFHYAMDYISGELYEDDNQVRQAGALWGLSCLNRDRFTEATRRAVLSGIDFFVRSRIRLREGSFAISYKDEEILKTGTAALFTLSLIEFLIGQKDYLPKEIYDKYDKLLDEQLEFLQSMEMADGSWARLIDLSSSYREQLSSPYYDGEALLAYCKALRYLNKEKLRKRIDYALPKLLEKYTVKSWHPTGDSDETKGFYQWGSMACAEVVEAGWKNKELAAEAALALAWWQIHDNNVESKGGNNAYALEGLIASLQVAKKIEDQKSQDLLLPVIKRILGRLMLCQVGGPFQKQNQFMQHIPRIHPKAYGGISSAWDSSIIRIDVVQHQLHALLMALDNLYQ